MRSDTASQGSPSAPTSPVGTGETRGHLGARIGVVNAGVEPVTPPELLDIQPVDVGGTAGLVIPKPSQLVERLCAAVEAAKRPHRITIPPDSLLVAAVLDALLAEPDEVRMEAMGMVQPSTQCELDGGCVLDCGDVWVVGRG